jgi:hypothetical protein
MLIDATTFRPIAERNVEVIEVVLCKRAPCPPIVLWSEKSDSDGIVQPPHTVVTSYTDIGAEGTYLEKFRSQPGMLRNMYG